MPEVWIVTLDLLGIAVFACTGAIVAVRKELDVFGASVLGLVTGLGGGVLRDVLIGAVPPAALVDWRRAQRGPRLGTVLPGQPRPSRGSAGVPCLR